MSGIEMYVGKSQSQASSVSAMCKSKTAGYKQLQTAINGFINNSPGLTGQTYNSAKSYFSAVLLPLVKGAELLTEAVEEACKKFPEQYVSEVDSADLKESELEQKIQQANRLIQQSKNAYDNLNRLDLPANIKAPMMSTAALTQMFQQTAKDELEKKLQKLRAFDASSPSIFSEISALEQAVKQGAAQVGKSWNSGTGTFTIPSDAEMGWAKSIEQRRFAKEYGIERPAGMSDKEYEVYLTKMQAQEKDLRVKDGWDKSAIKAYFQEANKQTKDLSAANAMKKVAEMYSQTLLVGSDLYTKMYEACSYSDQRKIDMVLKQLGAVMDKNGTLQLTGSHKFFEKMPPHSEFLASWAKTVQAAYKGRELDDARVHQLRMYIDRNNINYVRDTYGNSVSDEEALRQYALTELDGKKMIAEKGRLHNKYLITEGYTPGNENRKRTSPDFHSEFILDSNGKFVSQWNVLEFDSETGKLRTDWEFYKDKYPTAEAQKNFERQIMNGESYNYGNRNDKEHDRLDVNPTKNDYPLRKEIKERWKDPKDKTEYKWGEVDNKKDGYSKKEENIIKKYFK